MTGLSTGSLRAARSGSPPGADKAAKAATVVPIRHRDLPVETTAIAVPLIELADNACHWPMSGEGRSTLFCGADRGGSSHVSYCRHHAARSVLLVDAPGVLAAG
jgi:hypothetical protein